MYYLLNLLLGEGRIIWSYWSQYKEKEELAVKYTSD